MLSWLCCSPAICPAAGAPPTPPSASCLHQQSEEERRPAVGPEDVRPPASAAAVPGARHGRPLRLHTLLPSAAPSGASRQTRVRHGTN